MNKKHWGPYIWSHERVGIKEKDAEDVWVRFMFTSVTFCDRYFQQAGHTVQNL